MNLRNIDQFSKRFAEAVKQARKKKQLSHEKLAHLSGVTRITISNIEACRKSPTLATCYKVAAGLGVKLFELVKEAE